MVEMLVAAFVSLLPLALVASPNFTGPVVDAHLKRLHVPWSDPLAVPLLATKPHKGTAAEKLDERRCKWWHSPVLVGGTGGSGTRGVVQLLESLGVHVLGSNSTVCRGNSAGDTDCMSSCAHGADLAAFASMSVPAAQWRNLTQLIAHCNSTKATNVLLRLPVRYRQPWRWAWKHPSGVMYSLSKLREVFPCGHYVHVLRLPMDMAAVPFEHVGNRASEMRRVATALGYQGGTQAGAAAYLCNGDPTCLSVTSPLQRDAPNTRLGETTPEYRLYVSSSAARMEALRCWHLLLWSHVNPMVVRWGQSALSERGGVLLWPSEHTINSTVATQMETSLRSNVLRMAGQASGRRELQYGKWLPLALKHLPSWRNLTHCGPWPRLLSAFGYRVPSPLPLQTATQMQRLCPTCVRQ